MTLPFSYYSVTIINQFGVVSYIKDNIKQSTFFEENYVKVTPDNLTYPENDRNLIYIFVESFESTFTSKEKGGALFYDTIEPLEDLISSSINFSNTDQLGGASFATGTSWTVAALVSQTSGIHLSIPIEGNSMNLHSDFLPGTVSIGEILNERDYNQVFLLGSDANFGGRSNYFKQHGNYLIHDYYYALDKNLIPEGYHEWWGYEDEKLFEFAKEELLHLSSLDEPFNLTMLTADTHHIDGYLTEGIEERFEQQYMNVILNSSKQLSEFVEWIKIQDFYDNTTIIISGDHHTMDAPFIKLNVEESYNRKILNLVINSVVEPVNKANREFSTFDFFPTTLASLGYTIEGERLGIGTNLFSEKQTIFEEFGTNFTNNELSLKSSFYRNNIIVKTKER